MRCQAALLLAALLAAAAALPAAAAAATPSRRKLSQARAPRVKKVDWRVTLGVVAPDCFERPALLVNGQLGPTLEVTQGDFLEVCCDVPARLPSCLPACLPASNLPPTSTAELPKPGCLMGCTPVLRRRCPPKCPSPWLVRWSIPTCCLPGLWPALPAM